MASRPDAARDGVVSPPALTESQSPHQAAAQPSADFPDKAAKIATRYRARKFPGAKLSCLVVPPLGLVLIIAGWLALFHQLRADERRILDSAMHDTESFVAAFEQYTLGVIKEADRTALLVKDTFEREGRV